MPQRTALQLRNSGNGGKCENPHFRRIANQMSPKWLPILEADRERPPSTFLDSLRSFDLIPLDQS